MRAFRRICNEVDTASMPAKMRRMARARLDRVNNEYQRATRVVGRLLQAHGGRQGEWRPPAGGGYREEQKRRDDFCSRRASDSRMECEDSIPMERRSTLPVNEILASERRERSWESAAVPGRWGHPSAADRGREADDLDMAGLNIGAPTRLQRGGRALPPAGASTPLGANSGELPRTYSSSSATWWPQARGMCFPRRPHTTGPRDHHLRRAEEDGTAVPDRSGGTQRPWS
jgi:hypothetical protein